MAYRALAVLLTCLALTLGWKVEAPLAAPDEDSGVSPADIASMVKAGNAFAFDLYGSLSQGEGNLFFSPASVHAILTMTGAGARGETDVQMRRALHLTLKGDTLHQAAAAVLEQINTVPKIGRHKTPAYELVVANAVWAQQELPLTESFQRMVKKTYGAELNQINFMLGDTARSRINAWAAKVTEGKIRELIPAGGVDRWTRLVLADAIYFKSGWASAFPQAETRDAPFQVPGQPPVTVPMMHRTASMKYMENDSLQVLEMPYAGDGLSMIVFLPKEAAGLAKLERSVSPGTLDHFVRDRADFMVDLSFPRFKFARDAALAGALRAIGMADPFTGQANFSGLSDARGLFISQLFHQADVAVDEAGTEAAAATAITMARTSAPAPAEQKVFRADHPFLFLIRHNTTGSVLFMGRVLNPAG